MGYILGRKASASGAMGFVSRGRANSEDLITYSGDGHLITFAPTGTGKTSGPVICNALTHPGQLVVLDMKGEVYAKTAGARRAMGQAVHVLDLRDGEQTDSLNPLDLVARCGTDPAALARSFAAELIERGDERERFWSDWAETMIAGATAWLLADCPPENRTLTQVFELFTCDDPIYRMACLLDQDGTVKTRSARAAFISFLQLPDKETRPSVLGSTVAHLRLFDSDLTRKLTDTTTFDLDSFIAGEPMSLYIIVPPVRITAYRPLLRIWISGLILAMTQRRAPPKERTLMLCDEIGNLGRIDALVTATTLMRSWGLTMWSFWQNAAQLQIYPAFSSTATILPRVSVRAPTASSKASIRFTVPSATRAGKHPSTNPPGRRAHVSR